jgi:5-methyltetrahydrofolate--homocysteine methyltransferase
MEWKSYYNAFISQKDPENELLKLIDDELDIGISPMEIIVNRLMPALDRIGKEFSEGTLFLSELIFAGRMMKNAVENLRMRFNFASENAKGTLLLGTVAGDMHDIGKNLVGMLAEGAGFKVVDIGVDVSPEKFIEAIKKYRPDIVGLSALLTTTMLQMEKTVKLIKSSEWKDSVSIIIGGAPVTESFARRIGADAFGKDAVEGVQMAKELMENRA